MTKGKIQQQVTDWRARVENAPNPFKTPDAFGCAGYAVEEAGEFWKAMLRVIRKGDLRRVADHEAEPMDRELGQLAFMVCSTANALGIDLPDHYEATSENPVSEALECVEDLAYIAGMIYNDVGVVANMLHSVWIKIGLLANRLNIDIGAEIDVWMAERYEKAWGKPYVKQP